jgi:hypothetical protein
MANPVNVQEFYTTPVKVNALMRRATAFDANSNPTDEQVWNLIEEKMFLIDNATKTTFRLGRSTEYRHFDSLYSWGSGIRMDLDHRHVITPLSSTDGDSLKVFDGANWIEYVGVYAEDRGRDFWLDEQMGALFIRNTYNFTKNLAIKIVYRHTSGGRALVSGDMTIGVSGSVSLSSPYNMPMQGWARIESEEIKYNTLTDTSYNITERGAFNTTPATHASGLNVYWCPTDIQEACTKMVAISLLANEDWSSGGMTSGEMGAAQMGIEGKIRQYQKEVDDTLARYTPAFIAVR